LHSVLRRPSDEGRWDRRCCNGYRSAKPQGKPNFTIGNFSLCRRHFRDFAFDGTMRAFTPRSSRTLNCPSNLIGHDHPNNRPENGTRMIRQSVGGLAIRSCALQIKGARSDAKPGSTFADRALG
jgi:ribosomal protein S14